jgi:hypothetical protein
MVLFKYIGTRGFLFLGDEFSQFGREKRRARKECWDFFGGGLGGISGVYK